VAVKYLLFLANHFIYGMSSLAISSNFFPLYFPKLIVPAFSASFFCFSSYACMAKSLIALMVAIGVFRVSNLSINLAV
jgi:hypothetical protein